MDPFSNQFSETEEFSIEEDLLRLEQEFAEISARIKKLNGDPEELKRLERRQDSIAEEIYHLMGY